MKVVDDIARMTNRGGTNNVRTIEQNCGKHDPLSKRKRENPCRILSSIRKTGARP